ncbi:D-alanyl-D-alanine carboxypeptidase [Fervidobacterium thailandense]|uniref:D-alanyl-D-alanine carboxypeptidase n=1 Tax=Fervidobacterium thailandense TaxID=1008305 RepID=A0A1E3G1R4_9BACT|nr:D-alanyl-D-alanine carboxypeptidase [Fervidobacterium thailandense]
MVLSLLFLVILPSSSLAQELYKLIEQKAPANSFVGAYFVDVDGTVLVEYNAHKLFTPASLTKIFTTLLAWEVLGPDFKYTTTFYIPVGSTRPVIKGNLVIKANGDPSMSVDILRQNLKKFKDDGYTRIEGNIVVDNSFFSTERWGIGWEWDYKNPYIDALVLREYVTSFSANDKNAMALFYGGQVKQILTSYGIEVTGQVIVGKLTSGYTEYISIKSAPLKSLVDVANKFSSNSYAEQIFRTVGLRLYNLGSTQNSIRAMDNFVKRLFGESYSYRIVDGCGLSTYNLLTPYMVTQALVYAYKNHGGLDGFISTLALGGKEGTMEKRLGDIFVRAKTGTLQGVSNIAGIMRTKTGRLIAFCIMVNNFTAPTYTVMAYHDEIIRYVWNNY